MRVLKWLIILLLLAGLSLCSAPLLLVYRGLEPAPRVLPQASATQDDIARLRALWREHDPRQLASGESRRLTLAQRDINLAFATLNPLPDRQVAQVGLNPGLAVLHYSLQLPANAVGDYLNASLLLGEDDGRLRLEGLQLGDTELPGWWLMPPLLLADGIARWRIPEYSGVREALRDIRLQRGAVQVLYRWDAAVADSIEQRGRDILLPRAERERVAHYYGEIGRLSRQVSGRPSLVLLLQPLFASAAARSDEQTAAAENRALLLALGVALRGSSPVWLLGDETSAAPAPAVAWRLYRRGDLALHYALSASIAAAAGSALADAVGVFKELDDSRGGTGFSFVDLLADRAGVELAALATGADAARAQRLLAMPGLVEQDLLPDIAQLPEGLMEMTFRDRYDNLDDARYAQVKDEIDSRIAVLPLFRQVP